MAELLCSRCGATKAALDSAPMPGAMGDAIVRSVCAECWGEWVQTSIRVINHYGLHPASREHREKLFELMRDFLKLPTG